MMSDEEMSSNKNQDRTLSSNSNWFSFLWSPSNKTPTSLEGVGGSSSMCPVNHGDSVGASMDIPEGHPKIEGYFGSDAKCPVDDDAKKIWLLQNDKKKHTGVILQSAPIDIECSSDAIPAHPVYKTDVKLPDHRELSSIPRTGASSNWVYPSEKQFYEAMVRKNWDPEADDMKVVVPIHNQVNERVWNYIKRWEENEDSESCGGLKLTSFKGDSKKLTPRAWIRSTLLGYSKPFDRHDWTINRCGKDIDYVIDFYTNDTEDKSVPDIYLDVRPKLNTYEGIRLRVLKSLGY
ncbi:hypothetical protein Kpol_461p20 [Vanderwaltozyma polyspora DSM 70294]|uniref:Holocytochrome c-type synthase n=1 Tax=Vanderwaltozyma polyspora (strain ATCC 22028 / DSM 70294 / BCRC 21397 / CBS 2163 / NBRC 10782 / NRRL Y-8283 / UCD 57-17) TaxID=436907 RepID=A7TR56_VANPO|nr:uncharacterized protein Kpol_461p20 [Vanderwaltozyma polyspora DSM 70294]EDO15266.1 hypothetical protein Kpol_461p20 [Vanderwaltozyma polyspora DSM 70294]